MRERGSISGKEEEIVLVYVRVREKVREREREGDSKGEKKEELLHFKF